MKQILVMLTFLFYIVKADSQTIDTIRVGHQLKVNSLVANTTEHFVMIRVKDKMKTVVSLVEKEYLIKGSELHIVQRVTIMASGNRFSDSSIVDIKTFMPIAYYSTRNGQPEQALFKTNTLLITTGSGDTVKTKQVELEDIFFMLTTVVQLMERLPLQIGYSFVLSAYHPAQLRKSMQWYTVIGDEQVPLPNDDYIDAWVLQLHEKQGLGPRIWIDKKTQRLIKQVSELGGMQFLEKRLFE